MSDETPLEPDDDTPALSDRVAEYDAALATAVSEVIDDYEADIEGYEQTVMELQEEITDLEDTVDDLESRLKRKQADFENYKKRQQREQERIRERATEDLVERLLEVRDNLERALTEDASDLESLQEGVRMTLQQFDRVLDAEGVSRIEPAPGDDVDPNRHEVLMQVDAEHPEGTIVDVYRPGYELAEKILQTAQVTVSTGPETDPSDGTTAAEPSSTDS